MDMPAFPPDATRISGRRFLAHILDGITFSILALALSFAAAYLVRIVSESAADTVLGIFLVLLFTVGQIPYFVLTERRHGRSPGKYAARLKVVDAQGRTPGPGALASRTIPLLIEYFYVIAFIGMMSSDYRQRFGDRWAGTYVVLDERD